MTVHSLVRTVALIDGTLIISVQYIVIKTLSEQALLLVLGVWVLPQFSERFRYILGVIYVYVTILVHNQGMRLTWHISGIPPVVAQ
jgi:hypothetical protein